MPAVAAIIYYLPWIACQTSSMVSGKCWSFLQPFPNILALVQHWSFLVLKVTSLIKALRFDDE